jgi:hypothetical protein
MQLTTHGSLAGNRQIKAAVMGLVILGVIWELATWIVAGSDRMLVMFGLSLVVLGLVIHILNDWRSGVLFFMVWLLFEDLARKYRGNSMTVLFCQAPPAGGNRQVSLHGSPLYVFRCGFYPGI